MVLEKAHMTDFEGASGWASNANEVIELGLVEAAITQLRPIKDTAFNPTFTYPIFGEHEAIYGYKDLKVKLYFKADSLEPILDITYSEKLESEAGAADEQVESIADEAKVELETSDTQATDIVKLLKEHLPEDVSFDIPTYNRVVNQVKVPFVPPGDCISKYTNAKTSKTYEIFHSSLSDPACRRLVSNCQVLVLFLIEAGSTIDLDDEEWSTDRWDVYFLYEKKSTGTYSVVGYCTLFEYWWFSKDSEIPKDSNIQYVRSRISQFIILPPFQKHGHGGRFYSAIVGYLLEQPEVREITVEDPSETFEELRDRNDLRRLRSNGTFDDDDFNVDFICSQTPQSLQWIEHNRALNKMAARQFSRLVEMQLLTYVAAEKPHSLALKKYNLFVKRRLYRHNKDILSQLDKDERLEKLHATFANVVGDYDRLLGELDTTAAESGKGKAKRPLSMRSIGQDLAEEGGEVDTTSTTSNGAANKKDTEKRPAKRSKQEN